MKCEECQQHIADYLYDEIEEDLSRRLEEHFQACAACRTELQKLRATKKVLVAWPDQDPGLRLTFVAARQPLLPQAWSALRRWQRAGLAVSFALAALLVGLAVSNTSVSYKGGGFEFSASLWRRPAPAISREEVLALQKATLAMVQEMVQSSEQRQRLDFARALQEFAREVAMQRQADLGLVGRGLEELHMRTLTRLERTDRFLEELARFAAYEQRLRD
ncbi:MAG: zf-HC2 domain-containing protein [bacterium]|jgi:anti-sigma factor RsiW|nr:zf-HC2 domain-containing protein [candidate division KSB1 bacterium]MDH7561255.1 zf-HC2 domain-containing protein [bacterium]